MIALSAAVMVVAMAAAATAQCTDSDGHVNTWPTAMIAVLLIPYATCLSEAIRRCHAQQLMSHSTHLPTAAAWPVP